MNRNDLIFTLKNKGKYVGKKYTIQNIYELDDECDFVFSHYAVCVNKFITNGDENIFIPIPEKDFSDIEKAVDRFLELEIGQGPD